MILEDWKTYKLFLRKENIMRILYDINIFLTGPKHFSLLGLQVLCFAVMKFDLKKS